MRRSLLLNLAALAATSLPAAAFDCAKAGTDTEKLICSDAALKAVDDKLGEQWSLAKEEFSKQAFKALLADQRAWLKRRDEDCARGSDSERVTYLADMTQARIGELGAAARSDPGLKGKLEPFAIVKEAVPQGYQVDFTGFRFADPKLPGEVAFNEVVDKLVAEAPVDEKVDFDPPGGYLDFQQSMTLTYGSPDLMSVTVSTGRYDGGAHPNRYSMGYTVHMRDGVLDFGKVFSQKAVAQLSRLCFEGLKRPGGEKLSAQERRESMFDPTPQSMHEMVGNLSSWAFNEAGATMLFPPYAIAPYAAGDFECDLPLKTLKKLARNKVYLPD
jgi:uncharacterized protein